MTVVTVNNGLPVQLGTRALWENKGEHGRLKLACLLFFLKKSVSTEVLQVWCADITKTPICFVQHKSVKEGCVGYFQ